MPDSAHPPEDSGRAPGAPDEWEASGSESRLARVSFPEFPFPPVLPEEPDERAEVLRRFEAWEGRPERTVSEFPFPPILPDDPDELAELMRQFAAWQNHPEETRQLVLSTLWPGIIDHYLPGRRGISEVPAAQRLLDDGADAQDLSTAMRAAAYAVFSVLYRIDSMTDVDAPPEAPGWMLVEIAMNDNGEHESTGRHVGGLHESILGADPSGRDGSDLFA
jgi:hypothetical protein